MARGGTRVSRDTDAPYRFGARPRACSLARAYSGCSTISDLGLNHQRVYLPNVPKSTFSRKYDYFRALLIEARRNAKLTQVDLAERLRRPQSFVSKYERGERRLDVIEFLDVAVVLRIDVSTFLKKLDGKAAP